MSYFICTFANEDKEKNKIMAKEQSSIRERQRIDLREPRRYKVTIYNDDFTTMEFVVKILVEVFFKSETEAETLMLQDGVCGEDSRRGVFQERDRSRDADAAGTPLRQGRSGHLQL